MEHLQHFGLSQDPFSNEPDVRVFFPSGAHRDAQRRVERGLRQHKGLTLLMGEGGMGKTLLARRVLEALEDEVFEATLLVVLPGAADATGILQRFARQLGADEPANDRAALLGQIYEQLAIVREDGRHAVLMIDDAQIMTPATLAELGGLLSLEYEERRLLSMLLVGSPELDALVQRDPGMLARVDVRVRLQALDLDGTTAYLTHRLGSAKGDPSLLPTAAIQALHKFGRGRPRLLNTLADNALFEAYLAGRHAIDPHDVERAAADLGVGVGVGVDPGAVFAERGAAATVASATTVSAAMGAAPIALPECEPETVLQLDEPETGTGAMLGFDDPSLESATALKLDEPALERETVLQLEEPSLEPETVLQLEEPSLEPETVLQLETPMAELELTSEVDLALDESGVEPLDLDDGLEETFEAHARSGRPAPPPSLAEQTQPDPFEDMLDFDLGASDEDGGAAGPEDADGFAASFEADLEDEAGVELSFGVDETEDLAALEEPDDGTDEVPALSLELDGEDEGLDFALAEAELAPLEAGDADALDDAFVELLEE
ncbi:MAG: AAA family ATPase [Myxococcales bacterium]|nr:AAA family ATPase [Myxococcales bacterium]